jgi:hypothetical protein
MALVEIARFLDVREAQIARSALQASGLNAVLMDEYRAQNIWMEQLAIGGVRLFVPEADAEGASSFLDQIRNEYEIPTSSKRPIQAQASAFVKMLGFLAASFLFGWPLVAFKRANLGFRTFAGLWIVIVTIGIMATYVVKPGRVF